MLPGDAIPALGVHDLEAARSVEAHGRVVGAADGVDPLVSGVSGRE